MYYTGESHALSFTAQLTMEMAPSSPMSSSMEERPFVCPEHDCLQRFKRKFTLKEHIKTHTGEKPFTCPVKTCGKTFTTSGNLSRHKRLHPWLKPQACLVDGCGRSFSNEAKLERHMKTHFKGPRVLHACKVAGCGKKFSTTGNLTRHVRQQHSDELISDGEARRQVQSPCGVEESDAFSYPASPARKELEAFRFNIVSPDTSRAFNPLINQISDVNDDELLETLQCLF